MADIKWIKIATDIFDDEKILLIEAMPDADAMIVIWFKLLTLAGKQNNSGVFLINDTIPYTDEMLATIFRRPLNTVRLALDTFYKFGMIDIIEDTITIPKWEKHQNIDGMERIREQTRLRVARHREKQKLIEGNVTVTSCNATDKDKDKDKNKNTNNLHTNKKQRPTLEEIEAYVLEKNLNVDARKFFEYFEAGEWLDSKGKPVRSWKQKIITWSNSNGTNSGTSGTVRSGVRSTNGRSKGDPEQVETGFIPSA